MLKRFFPVAVAVILLLSLQMPASAAIDELAFGSSPAVMVYLFAVQEAGQMPDSPYTKERLNKALAFCNGKLSQHLVDRLKNITDLVNAKKFAQAKKEAKGLQAEIYGE